MRFIKRVKHLIRMVVCGALICTTIVPVYAQNKVKRVSATVSDCKIYIDDELYSLEDSNGNSVSVLEYNGMTYVPIEVINRALTGDSAGIETSTNDIYIDSLDTIIDRFKKPANANEPSNLSQPKGYLTDLTQIFATSSWGVSKWSGRDNIGNNYVKGILFRPQLSVPSQEAKYVLDSKYSRIKGKFVLREQDKNTKYSAVLTVYGDDRILYTSSVLTGGSLPIDVDIDVSTVSNLTVEATFIDGGSLGVGFVNPVLY